MVWSSVLSGPKQNVGSTAVVLNDVYKLWTDMHNLFIYSSTVTNVEQRKELKRTSVHIMPRAIPCTATCDPRYGRGRCGAFGAPLVRARKAGV